MQDIETKKKSVDDNVRTLVRDRGERPLSSDFYYGPTNSGKTYHALEALCTEYEHNPSGTYVYAGPLRMLALEVYEKLVAKYGIESVGLITGEEQINPMAPMLSTTTEMAPQEGDAIVIDESHWIADESRGNSWTRLLMTGKYEKFHIVSAEEAGPILESLMKDSQRITRHNYKRKTDISYKGNISLRNVPSRSAIICFSKKKVYEVALLLEKQGIKAGVLYGALPPSVRKQQIALFIAGEYDVIVTTDVIGHGINLPIDNVVFTQTNKFDGREVRSLKRWEIAQIAGRAGRFGLSTEGSVYTVKLPKYFVSPELVEEGVLCAKGKMETDLGIEEAVLKPRLSDLGLLDTDSIWLTYALTAWQSKAMDIKELVCPASLDDVNENIGHIADYLKCYINPWDSAGGVIKVNGKDYIDARKKDHDWALALKDLWTIANGPYDAETGVLKVISTWLVSKDNTIISAFFQGIERSQKSSDIDILEHAAHQLTELKMAAVMFSVGDRLGSLQVRKLAPLEEKIVMKIGKLLIKQNVDNENIESIGINTALEGDENSESITGVEKAMVTS